MGRCFLKPCPFTFKCNECVHETYRPLTDAEVEEMIRDNGIQLPDNVTIASINDIRDIYYKGSPVKLIPWKREEG
jgi:hypothetical protein